jgi:hypothetical protein
MNNMMLKSSEVNLLESIFNRKNGLGTIFKANYQSEMVTCRQIKFDRLSRYDLEGLYKDLEEIMYVFHPNVCPIIGVCADNIPTVYIMWNYFAKGSLYDILHVEKMEISLNKRLEIAK